jgi:hypothetical protein
MYRKFDPHRPYQISWVQPARICDLLNLNLTEASALPSPGKDYERLFLEISHAESST